MHGHPTRLAGFQCFIMVAYIFNNEFEFAFCLSASSRQFSDRSFGKTLMAMGLSSNKLTIIQVRILVSSPLDVLQDSVMLIFTVIIVFGAWNCAVI